ncbi:MAG TPA: xanthine dehydrogenase family protein subunit M [Hyphomicrobiaceae bacterium]|nr:xanthine dehydrogenase family protein subunit M [Hyphomicrobiaceae bacterium]
MHSFEYLRPQSVADAAKLLASKPEAKLLAGGHTLIPTMKQRLAAPKALIDLGKLPDLKGIEKKGSALVIGAMTTHAEVAESAVVKSAIAGLAALAGMIGDPQVRHRGTIGGSVANNDPSADYPAALLALNATVITNKREIKADAFFKGLFETALADGEIITKISFPLAAKFAYAKFANPASRYAMVGVAVAQTGGAVRVAVTGAGSDGVYRLTAAETALAKDWSAAALNGIAGDPAQMISDIHGDAAYRAHLVGVMARRAVAAAG